MARTHYFAKKDKEKHSLATDEAADKMLLAGYMIVARTGDEETILATPEAGWIAPRPEIVRKYEGCSIIK